jgi:Cu+-exporting ATPase
MAAAASDAQAGVPGCLAPPPANLELDIDGMTCGACVRSVESALARLPPGLHASTVTLGHASVRFSPQLVSAADIAQGASSASSKWHWWR